MDTWIVFLIIAMIFFIAEIFTPTQFFLSFSIAGVICSGLSVFTSDYNILVPIFAVSSIISILFLRTVLNINPKKDKTQSFESQYIGKLATAITDINAFSGRLKIYDEDWEARLDNEDASEIRKGSKVVIVRHNDLTMFVKKNGRK